jgi:hypothetical protein
MDYSALIWAAVAVGCLVWIARTKETWRARPRPWLMATAIGLNVVSLMVNTIVFLASL